MRTIIRAMADISNKLAALLPQSRAQDGEAPHAGGHGHARLQAGVGLVDGDHRVHRHVGDDLVDVGALDDASEVEAAVVEEGMAPLEPPEGFLRGRHALRGPHVAHPHDLGEVEAAAQLAPSAPGLAEQFHGPHVGGEPHPETEPVPLVSGGHGHVLHVDPAARPLFLRRIGAAQVRYLDLAQQPLDHGVDAAQLPGAGQPLFRIRPEVHVLQGGQRGRGGFYQGGHDYTSSIRCWSVVGAFPDGGANVPSAFAVTFTPKMPIVAMPNHITNVAGSAPMAK